MKRTITIASSILLGLSFVGATIDTQANAYQGTQYEYNKSELNKKRTGGTWVNENGHYGYYNRYGVRVYGWAKIDGVQYYFDQNGHKVTGIYEVDGVSYQFSSKGAYISRAYDSQENDTVNNKKNYQENDDDNVSVRQSRNTKGSWTNENGHYGYYNRYGVRVYGWAKIDGVQYYFDENGHSVRGTTQIDGESFEFDSDGAYAGRTYSKNNNYSKNKVKSTESNKYKKNEQVSEDVQEVKTNKKSNTQSKENYKNNTNYENKQVNKENITSKANTSSSKGGYSGKTYTSNATAYAGDGTTASGQAPRWGTIAVDPSVIPLGSRVYIPYFNKVFIANDTGGVIKGTKIDIFMNSEAQANDFGRRNLEIVVLD
ncbi:3D domain-containing protein [Peptostreptococcus equinus]|uniref:3D domain-containing protein n=1 Tax=Peptostreptococcus equinus TaxID=3003601 RepID=A0ABY7JQ63_9FIRM|nr:3D domain-containing protein [Peptostreptococcus sp. CBA3647]WAW15490.1 3D domain-containing protein [Peptostreptococcus sp. CBA3647]